MTYWNSVCGNVLNNTLNNSYLSGVATRVCNFLSVFKKDSVFDLGGLK